MHNQNENQRHLVLKNAKVPLKTCLKLALKNMWKKKFRYLVMFLICTLSLTFFSVTIELNGEKLRQNVYTMIENGYRYTDIYEHVQLTDRELEENEYNQFASQPLSGESYGTIKEKVSNITIHEYKEVQINYAGINLENGDYFFTGYLNTIIKFDNTNNYELIAGRLPKEDTKEILITDYLVEAFDYFNLYPDANNVYDYLNKRINLQHESNYIIVGIIKTNYENWKHFANVETIELSDKANYSYTNDMIIMNIYQTIFTLTIFSNFISKTIISNRFYIFIFTGYYYIKIFICNTPLLFLHNSTEAKMKIFSKFILKRNFNNPIIQ